MSTVITEIELKEMVQNGKIIQNGDVLAAEGIKYDFRMGSQFLKASFGRPKDYNLDLKSDESFKKAVVEPGEVVFVLSKERICIPNNIYVQLTPKRKMGHEGIQLLGGTTIDPGYEGYLIFGLNNVAGTPFPLKPDRKLVGATFYRLSDDEVVKNPTKVPDPMETFPENLIDFIGKYKPINPQSISEEIKSIKDAMTVDRTELYQQIEGISKETSETKKTVDKMDKTIVTFSVWVKVIAWVLSIGSAIIIGIATGFFSKLFGLG